jgi:predicted DNA-binding transcriptional regulator AlpA
MSDTDELLATSEFAEFIKRPPRTLERWRITGCGPRFVRCGRSVRYKKSEVQAWLERNTFTPGGEDSKLGQ